MDRGWQCHKQFDRLQRESKSFVCRIKRNTTLTVINENTVDPDSYIFCDSVVLPGTPGISRSEIPLRVIAYRIGSQSYFIATDRHDLSESNPEIYCMQKLNRTLLKIMRNLGIRYNVNLVKKLAQRVGENFY